MSEKSEKDNFWQKVLAPVLTAIILAVLYKFLGFGPNGEPHVKLETSKVDKNELFVPQQIQQQKPSAKPANSKANSPSLDTQLPALSEEQKNTIVITILANEGDWVEVKGKSVTDDAESSQSVRKFNVLANEEYEITIGSCPTRRVILSKSTVFHRCN